MLTLVINNAQDEYPLYEEELRSYGAKLSDIIILLLLNKYKIYFTLVYYITNLITMPSFEPLVCYSLKPQCIVKIVRRLFCITNIKFTMIKSSYFIWYFAHIMSFNSWIHFLFSCSSPIVKRILFPHPNEDRRLTIIPLSKSLFTIDSAVSLSFQIVVMKFV